MASVLHRYRISIEQAEQEFDLLFDEYLRETDNIQSDGFSCYVSRGDDRLEGRSAGMLNFMTNIYNIVLLLNQDFAVAKLVILRKSGTCFLYCFVYIFVILGYK